MAIQYLENIEARSVSPIKQQLPEIKLDEDGKGLLQSMEIFFQRHGNHIAATSGPRYWGFVIGGVTPAALAGDWLCSVFDQNPGNASGPGDISASIELETIKLLLELFGLPETYDGSFVTGGTMANFTGLAIGRQWAGLQNNNDIAREGIKTDIKIFSATPHSSAVKSLSMLGVGSNNIITLKTSEPDREVIDIIDLQEKLEEFRNQQVILISSAGTVNSVDFDDMMVIASLQKEYSFYWHIDAAFGGFAACSESYRRLLEGWESADSIAIDLHKWMNVPYDSAVCFINQKHTRLRIQTFQNGNAPYLGNPEEDFNFMNAGPENSRRLRALPVLLSLMAYGKNGFGWIVENSISMAKLFAERLQRETDFILAAPVRLNVVCFTVKNENTRNEKLKLALNLLNKNGKVFMTASVYKGVPCIRAAFVNWRTGENDIAIAIDELKRALF